MFTVLLILWLTSWLELLSIWIVDKELKSGNIDNRTGVMMMKVDTPGVDSGDKMTVGVLVGVLVVVVFGAIVVTMVMRLQQLMDGWMGEWIDV